MGLNPGERLKFRVGEHQCPHGMGTPHDCGQLVQAGTTDKLHCALQEESAKACPFDPTIILVLSEPDKNHSSETLDSQPLD